MSKFSTAVNLAATGSFRQFSQRLRIYLRHRKLTRYGQSSFIYQLHDFPFVCVPSVADSVDTYLTSKTDIAELRIIKEWLHPGDTFIDIGANLGIYLSAASAYIRHQGACLGIEASPPLAAQLLASLRLLGIDSAQIEQKAVGSSNLDTLFHLAPLDRPTGEQSLHPDPALAANYIPVPVRQETLSSLISRHPAFTRPALIKMDIEGSEPDALCGAPASWFTPDGPLWIIELNPSALARSGSDCATLAAYFSPEVFDRWLSPQFPRQDGCALPLRRLTSAEHFVDALFYNLIAVPRANPRRLPSLPR